MFRGGKICSGMTRGLRLLDAAGLEQKGDCKCRPGDRRWICGLASRKPQAAWQLFTRLEDAPGMHRYSVRSTGRSFIIVSLCFWGLLLRCRPVLTMAPNFCADQCAKSAKIDGRKLPNLHETIAFDMAATSSPLVCPCTRSKGHAAWCAGTLVLQQGNGRVDASWVGAGWQGW